MARNIIIVNATQVVTSESHPEGIFSVMSGFPKVYDSGNGGDIEQNMKTAKAAYYDQLSKNYANTNPARVMTTITLEMASGEQILRESIGGYPVVEPEPETEPEEPEEEPAE
jgi:hypothetical protein